MDRCLLACLLACDCGKDLRSLSLLMDEGTMDEEVRRPTSNEECKKSDEGAAIL
jgi:hypothetical protein